MILYSGGKNTHWTKEFNWVEIYRNDNCVPWKQTFTGVTYLKTWYLIWDVKAQLKLANLKIEPSVPGTGCRKFKSIEVIGNLVNFHFWKWNVWSKHRARSKVYDEAREVGKTQTMWILKGYLILNLESDKSCFKHDDMVRTGWKSCYSCNVEMS